MARIFITGSSTGLGLAAAQSRRFGTGRHRNRAGDTELAGRER